MTRKRFIKLCMAQGFSRNEANKEATECREFGYSYLDFYKRNERIAQTAVRIADRIIISSKWEVKKVDSGTVFRML